MPPASLTNFEIQMYYQNERKFNSVCSRNSLTKMKDLLWLLNLDEFKSIRNHWIPFYLNSNNVTYFDNFGVEHILKRIKQFIRKQKFHNKYL